MGQRHPGDYLDLGNDELDWEAFWNQNEVAIRDALATEMRAFFDLFPDRYQEQKRQEDLTKKLQKEKEFVKLLLPKLKELLAQPKKVLMLVDIDETIGGKYSDTQRFNTIIRPAFLAVLNKLQPAREVGKLEVGLLTTRGELQKQLDDPAGLQKIKSHLHPSHLYSTSDYHPEGRTNIALRRISERENSVLRPGLTNENYNDFSNDGAVIKLKALENILEQNPDTAILVVDDHNFVKYLNQNSNLHGLHIDETVTFWVRE